MSGRDAESVQRSHTWLSPVARDVIASAIVWCSVAAFAFWSNPTLGAQTAVDTKSYVDVASDFSLGQERLLGYPLLIRFAEALRGASWPQLVVGIQMLLVATGAWILFFTLRRIGLTRTVAVLTVLPAGLAPGMIAFSSVLLPEVLLGFVISTAVAICVWMCVRVEDMTARTLLTLGAVAGAVSGVAFLVKPIWLLGILPLAAAVAVRHWRRMRTVAALLLVMLGCHFGIVGSWYLFLRSQNADASLPRVGTQVLNLMLIHAGMTEYGAGTPLYDYLRDHGLLDSAKALHWGDLQDFDSLKDRIPWSYATDRTFAHAVLGRHPGPYAALVVRRWPRFIRTSPARPAASAFPAMPSVARRLYLRAYDALYRWALLPLAIMMIVCCARIPAIRWFGVASGLALLFFSIVVAALTYQDPHFIRMRTPVDPLLITFCLAPIALVVDRIVRRPVT